MNAMNRETVKFGNGAIELDVLRDGGPRVVRLSPGGSELNLLAVVPDAVAVTVWGPYHFLGGHRLWHAPEAAPRSYDPDDAGVTIHRDGLELLAQGPVEAHTGIRKSIRFVLDSTRPLVHVEHTLENQGVWPAEMGAWAITQMCLGGVGILPLRKPGMQDGLLADRQVAIWPYADLKDTRLHMDNDWFLVDGISHPNAFKVGAYNPCGWVAYFYEPFLFVKRFTPVGGMYADFGCNAEIYVRDVFIEIETQGPLTTLEPGASMIHVEEWELLKVKAKNPVDAVLEAGLNA